jgi:hypothetical protein
MLYFNADQLNEYHLCVLIKSQSNTDLSDATDFNGLMKIFNLFKSVLSVVRKFFYLYSDDITA